MRVALRAYQELNRKYNYTCICTVLEHALLTLQHGYSSPHKKVPTTLEYYVGSRLEVARILRSYGVLRSVPTAYYSAHIRGVAVA